MTKSHKILFALGGTGGHLFPAVELAKQLKSHSLLFAGAGLENNPFLERADIAVCDISSDTPFSSPVRAGFQLSKGVFQSLKLIKQFSPDLVIGFGSFHSVPILAAARMKNIPYLLFEPNAEMGKANRLFAKKATQMALQFEGAGKGKLLNFPLNGQIALVEAQEARQFYGLDPKLPTLLIFGGSQGAQFFNENLPDLAADLPLQVIHLAGKKADCEAIASQWKIPAKVLPFEENMARAYSAATLAVCRAGAASLSELIAVSLPALLIPYPYAYAHQSTNGAILQKAGGALVLPQSEATIEKISQSIGHILTHHEEMKENLKKFKLEGNRQTFSSIVMETLQSL